MVNVLIAENGCQNCTLKVNELDQTEKLVCTNCINDRYYILTNNSHCVHINSFVQKIPFCSYQENYFEKYAIVDNTTLNNTPNMDMDNFNFGNGTNNNTNNTKYEYKIRSTCYGCIDGYIKEGEENPCLPLGIENCSLSSLFDLNTSNFKEEEYHYKDFWENYHKCERLCSGSKYVKINYYYETTEQVKVRYESNNTNENCWTLSLYE